uniref:Uncharacterized protein n=1 Tax=Romanomermis culicivorax TaxID=13658 RepID=A0A915K2U1_ROMCU
MTVPSAKRNENFPFVPFRSIPSEKATTQHGRSHVTVGHPNRANKGILFTYLFSVKCTMELLPAANSHTILLATFRYGGSEMY